MKTPRQYLIKNGKVYELAMQGDAPAKGHVTDKAEAHALAKTQAEQIGQAEQKKREANKAAALAKEKERLKAMDKDVREGVDIRAKDPAGYEKAIAQLVVAKYKTIKR